MKKTNLRRRIDKAAEAFFTLLGCGDLDISISEPIRDIDVAPRVAFDCEFTILDEDDEAAGDALGTTGHHRLMAHHSFHGETRMTYRKEIAAAGIVIADQLSFPHKRLKLPWREHARRQEMKNLYLVPLEHTHSTT